MSFQGGQMPNDALAMKISQTISFTVINGCFSQCVNDFKTDRVQPAEISCLQNCAARNGTAFASMQEIQPSAL